MLYRKSIGTNVHAKVAEEVNDVWGRRCVLPAGNRAADQTFHRPRVGNAVGVHRQHALLVIGRSEAEVSSDRVPSHVREVRACTGAGSGSINSRGSVPSVMDIADTSCSHSARAARARAL